MVSTDIYGTLQLLGAERDFWFGIIFTTSTITLIFKGHDTLRDILDGSFGKNQVVPIMEKIVNVDKSTEVMKTVNSRRKLLYLTFLDTGFAFSQEPGHAPTIMDNLEKNFKK